MNVMLTGASGFIGQRLIARLLRDGHSVHAIGRNRPSGFPEVEFSTWDAGSGDVPRAAIEGADAIIHLAGEPVAQRWNRQVKSRIHDSRVMGTHAIVQALSRSESRPTVMVAASAVGYYGNRGDEILTEASEPGVGFLSEVCVDWEKESRAAGHLGLRVVSLRIGIVLGSGGGALKQMLPPFRLGMGGPIGSGKQWMAWIHVDDLIEVILFSLGHPDLFGHINATAPNPVRNEEFAKALGEVLGRPAVLHTPVFALKALLGEAAEVVLASQRVVPRELQHLKFEFRYPEIREALRHAI